MTAPTIVARIARAQLSAVAAVATFAVITGGLAGAWTALRRDDATSLAIGRVLAMEVAQHLDSDAALDAEMVEEVGEDRGFGRQIEVYRGTRRIGTDGRAHVLGPAARTPDQCATESHGGVRWRVCTVPAPSGVRIEIGTPLAPLVQTIAVITGSIAVTTLLTVLAFALVNRRAVARTLAPLARLERAVADLEGARVDARLGPSWGAAEVDALAATFDALLGRIDEALQRERRFLVDVSHELRTPLTRLRAQLELVCDEVRGDTAVGDQLRAATATCVMLVRVTESVLALARSEVPHDEAVDVGDAVRAHCETLEAMHARRVEITAPEEALVRADPALIRLATSNLIDNALKFSTGRVGITVTDGDEITCTVEDDGPGIPESDRVRVFEPFFRGRAARSRTAGVGLGLALVHHVATAYAGRITLSPGATGGLRATLSLPRWRPG